MEKRQIIKTDYSKIIDLSNGNETPTHWYELEYRGWKITATEIYSDGTLHALAIPLKYSSKINVSNYENEIEDKELDIEYIDLNPFWHEAQINLSKLNMKDENQIFDYMCILIDSEMDDEEPFHDYIIFKN